MLKKRPFDFQKKNNNIRRSKTEISNKHLKDLLPFLLSEINKKKSLNPELIFQAWSRISDTKWKGMTEPIGFEKGVFMVKVKNAALYSVLVQVEYSRLLSQLRHECSHVEIKNIVFRIG